MVDGWGWRRREVEKERFYKSDCALQTRTTCPRRGLVGGKGVWMWHEPIEEAAAAQVKQ